MLIPLDGFKETPVFLHLQWVYTSTNGCAREVKDCKPQCIGLVICHSLYLCVCLCFVDVITSSRYCQKGFWSFLSLVFTTDTGGRDLQSKVQSYVMAQAQTFYWERGSGTLLGQSIGQMVWHTINMTVWLCVEHPKKQELFVVVEQFTMF